jgi:hypothetical protein
VLGEHPFPAGPLAVRWLEARLGDVQAGALTSAHAVLENAGTATWHDLKVSYHWLDDRGNPIVWDGIRHSISARPGERVESDMQVRGPVPPGTYLIAFDLVDEGRFWLAELGNFTPELEVVVRPRDPSRSRQFAPAKTVVDNDLIRAAHAVGYAAVGGSIDMRRPPPELEAYAPGGGRNPAFAHPLVCPSLLPPLEPNAEVAGLPAWQPEGDEPWIYDARIRLRLRSGRRHG